MLIYSSVILWHCSMNIFMKMTNSTLITLRYISVIHCFLTLFNQNIINFFLCFNCLPFPWIRIIWDNVYLNSGDKPAWHTSPLLNSVWFVNNNFQYCQIGGRSMGELPPPPAPETRSAESQRCLVLSGDPPSSHPIFSCYRKVQIDVFHRIILISFGPKCCLSF